MNSMDGETYLRDRVDHQIAWFDKASMRCKRNYQLLRGLEISTAASIPLLSAYAEWPYATLGIGLLGVAVVVITGFQTLFGFEQDWLRYRILCEALTSEKLRFESGLSPYDRQDSFPILFESVEGILAKERGLWASAVRDRHHRFSKPAADQLPPVGG